MARYSPPHRLAIDPRSLILCSLVAISGVLAQPREDHSNFDVASVRPVDHAMRFSYTGPQTGDPGRIAWSRISLKDLIVAAYSDVYTEYHGYRVRVSGPPWIEDEYSVTALIPPGSTSKDVSQMLRNLVTERFGLKFHDENKDAGGFALVVGEGGFKLTPSTTEAGSTPPSNSGATITPFSRPDRDKQGFPLLTPEHKWGSFLDHQLGVERASFRQCSMKALANMLSLTYTQGSVLVVDNTEIKGLFDFNLVLPAPSFTPLPARLATQMPPSSVPNDSGVDLRGISGSLEKQTGLRLKTVKLTLRTMMIDQVARTPTEN